VFYVESRYVLFVVFVFIMYFAADCLFGI